MYSPKKTPSSPLSSQRVVNYFNHFPRQRLIPYGQVSESTPDKTMVDKANLINCEYLLRPKIGMSEFAETVQTNMFTVESKLENMNSDLIRDEIYKLDEVIMCSTQRIIVQLPTKMYVMPSSISLRIIPIEINCSIT